jgi:hypothetical protein
LASQKSSDHYYFARNSLSFEKVPLIKVTQNEIELLRIAFTHLAAAHKVGEQKVKKVKKVKNIPKYSKIIQSNPKYNIFQNVPKCS